MLIVGVILLVLGLVTGISILTILGVILLIVGAVLWLVPSLGGGRRYY